MVCEQNGSCISIFIAVYVNVQFKLVNSNLMILKFNVFIWLCFAPMTLIICNLKQNDRHGTIHLTFGIYLIKSIEFVKWSVNHLKYVVDQNPKSMYIEREWVCKGFHFVFLLFSFWLLGHIDLYFIIFMCKRLGRQSSRVNCQLFV